LGYRSISQDQHEALLRLIESKNKQAALNHLRQHIEQAGKLLSEYLKEISY
jgi:DNA-binding GntR family transcriptional regulator